MTKYLKAIPFLFLALFLATSTYAVTSDIVPVGKDEPVRTVNVPQAAVDNSKSVVPLGQARDVDGTLVEGYMFIHYEKGYAKPDRPDKPGKPPKNDDKCYSYLANGAEWRDYEWYTVDPTNSRDLDETEVENLIAGAIGKWGDAAGKTVGDGGYKEIIGPQKYTNEVDGIDTVSADGKNEVLFGSIDEPSAIAVTVVWFYSDGPPKNRELVEWDMLFDQVDYDWSTEGAAGFMDFDNILTHEMGHAFGMGHAPDSCMEETMYPYAGLGETLKRDLFSGDILGIWNLYK